METPGEPSYSIQSTLTGSLVTVRTGRAWLPLFFLTAWLGGWALGEAAVIGVLFGLGPMAEAQQGLPLFAKAFLGFWLAVWSAAGFFAFSQWLQFWGSEEIIEIGQGRMKITRGVWKLAKTREYDLNLVKQLRLQDLGPLRPYTRKFASMPFNTLQFNYGSKTISFASKLSEVDAQNLLQDLQSRHTQLRG